MAEQEPIIGRPTTEEIPADQIGRLTSQPSGEDEAGGRGCGRQQMARCAQCGSLQYLSQDGARYRAYECNTCGAIIVF